MHPLANMTFFQETTPHCDAQCPISILWPRDIADRAQLSKQAKIGLISAGAVTFLLLVLILACCVLRRRLAYPQSVYDRDDVELSSSHQWVYLEGRLAPAELAESPAWSTQVHELSFSPTSARVSRPAELPVQSTQLHSLRLGLGEISAPELQNLGDRLASDISLSLPKTLGDVTYANPRDLWGPSLQERENLASQSNRGTDKGTELGSLTSGVTETASISLGSPVETSVTGMAIHCKVAGCVRSCTSQGEYK
jgi:hypothetical protein